LWQRNQDFEPKKSRYWAKGIKVLGTWKTVNVSSNVDVAFKNEGGGSDELNILYGGVVYGKFNLQFATKRFNHDALRGCITILFVVD
jgi:hypothetical protein